MTLKNKKQTKKQFVITDPLDHMLDALGWLYYARADQITRLLYSPSSLTFVRAHLKRLCDENYVKSISIYSGSKPTPLIYTLSSKGMEYLKGTGRIPEDRRFRPSEVEVSPFFLPHTLDVNDFLIAFSSLAKQDRRFQMISRMHDIDLKREKRLEKDRVVFTKLVGDAVVEKKMYLYPDAFLLLSMEREGTGESGQPLKPRKFGLWLEIDRNSETDARKFKDRVRGIVSYHSSGKYEEKYGTKSLVVAYLITQGGHHRMEVLRDLARLELASTNEKAHTSRMFRFIVVPSSWDYLDLEKKTGSPFAVAKALLLESGWAVPFVDHDLMPLLVTK